jgi:hypothetical protein
MNRVGFQVVGAALVATVALSPLTTGAQVQFDRVFAPQEGLVSVPEQPVREEICLNGAWRFQADNDTTVPGDELPSLAGWEEMPIKIPSPWNVNSFSMREKVQGGDFVAYPSYPKEWEEVRAAWMMKSTNVPKEWEGKQILLHFGAVSGRMVVYVNGKPAGEGFDIFFAQQFDVTEFVKFGAENQILVKVISPKVFDQPGPYGRREYLSGSFWGTHIAGIWQDVFLLAQPKLAVTDLFVQPWVDRNELRVEATLTNRSSAATKVELNGSVHEWINEAGNSVEEAPEVKWRLADDASLGLATQSIELAPGGSKVVTLSATVDRRLKLWSPAQPNLYGLVLRVTAGGKVMDLRYQRFGWRQFTFKGSELCLNGAPIELKGDSWHFMGVPQMTRRYAYGWYQLLKDAGANTVRLHASIYPSFYHDMADEMGIMILDESAIWLSDGGPKADSDVFWSNCRTHVMELVLRDRNHPSVFGWSICNEILPVMRNVWHMPQNMVYRGLDEMTAWGAICRANDPTRGWISGDGEFDAEGRLPTINIHYGGEGELRRARQSGKPWGVGETSMAYYGTPKLVSKFNGERAYESALGRMEGLAFECYGLLRDQQQFGAGYQSVFNIVWYGVQPLPFGKSDFSRSTTPEEGVFFGKFREGAPGMQPERLGPYTSTVNPGFDPALPLYRPWPMFEAIRDVNLKVTNSPWARLPVKTTTASSSNAKTNGQAVLSFVPENGIRLAQGLGRAGARTRPFVANGKTDIFLLDASTNQTAAVAAAVRAVLDHGGTIWVWDVQPGGAKMLSELFGEEVQVHPHAASSFIVKQDDPLIAGLDNAALYFSEADDWQQMSFSLAGAFLDGAKIPLEACPAEWRHWNYQAEPVKTAALFRSERENSGPPTAIVIRPVGRGRVIICNMDPMIKSQRKAALVQRLLINEGVELIPVESRSGFLDFDGRLVRALVAGGFGFKEANEAYDGKGPAGEIRENGAIMGRTWKLHDADSSGVFDFKKGLVGGDQSSAVAYLAVWIKSSKPLNDLLSEPNLPRLSFIYGCDDGSEIWLNGELLSSHRREGPLDAQMFKEDPLLLKLGWNQLVIKVVQNQGEWKFAGRFGCSDLGFLSKLEFAPTKPVQ